MERLLHLDLVRGVCALLVCAGHMRASILCDRGEVASPNFFHTVFYACTGIGHQAVIVFFVMSGLFVGGSVLRTGRRFDSGEYLTARVVRLWVVLLPALALTLLADTFTLTRYPEVADGVYYAHWHSGPISNNYSTSPPTFLANVCFLQTFVAPVYGTNGPLWSLAYEFWYYTLFPLLAIAAGIAGGIRPAWVRVVAGVVAVGTIALLPFDMQIGFLAWLLGVLVHFVGGRMGVRRRPIRMVVAIVSFGASVAYTISPLSRTVWSVPGDLVVGLGFSPLCLLLARWPCPGNIAFARVYTWIAESLGNISYSLYAVHFPIVILLATHLFDAKKVQPTMVGLLCFVGCLLTLVALGSVFWFLFERHTPLVKRVVTDWLRHL